jgi:hypothetical protein
LEKDVSQKQHAELKYQVQHCAIDLHTLNFIDKIKAIRDANKGNYAKALR